MAKRTGRDPLRYAAKLTAAAALVYLGTTAVLKFLLGWLCTMFHANATLANPIGVPEWMLGIYNLLLPAVGLGLAFWMMYASLRGSSMALKISYQVPRQPQLWLFLPVFLGVALLGDMLTSLLQRLLEAHTAYVAPTSVQLPDSDVAMLLYFLGLCAVPAVFEELFVRGAVQRLFSRWGTWFSIGVSGVLFMLLHKDIAQMPAVLISSVLLGVAAHCTGTLLASTVLHFAHNAMMFCFMVATQKMDGISAFAFTGYLTAVFLLSAVACAVLIAKRKVLRMFRPIPRVCDPRNRQSRLERLAQEPVFLLTMLALAVRAVLPLFVSL